LAQKDHALLRALSRGEFALSGIRNADLRDSKGRRIITALLAACYADVDQLTKMAA